MADGADGEGPESCKRPLPDDMLEIVAEGQRSDQPEAA